MPTLSQVTEGHSRRLSDITRARNLALDEANADRDAKLRALPGAAARFDAFDEELDSQRATQLTTEAKAAAARTAALEDAIADRSAALEAADLARREADLAASAQRKKAEEAAEAKFRAALAALGPHELAKEAARTRDDEIARAKKEFDSALDAAQRQFRKATEDAFLAERKQSTQADRSHQLAVKFADDAARAARAAAEQSLVKELGALPGGPPVIDAWRQAIARIQADHKRAEAEEFARFRAELDALKG